MCAQANDPGGPPPRSAPATVASLRSVTVLWYSDPRMGGHDAGDRHPESPARLAAVEEGLSRSGVVGQVQRRVPRPVDRARLEDVHHESLLATIDGIAEAGGGPVDMDTAMSAQSLLAAQLAAGAGIDAIEALDRGEAAAAFCAVRPPGHHATADASMGFCLYNNVAVAATTLAKRGERVAIVDIDVHHGNGTQAIFSADPAVLFVSTHQQPLYPGSGGIDERGDGPGEGATINLPVPAGATGDLYRQVFDTVIGPAVDRFGPTWLLVSAGFDAHRRDPIAQVQLTAADYAELVGALQQLVPAGRRIVFLEGGYDLEAMAECTAATVATLAGERYRGEPSSDGGASSTVAAAAADLHGL